MVGRLSDYLNKVIGYPKGDNFSRTNKFRINKYSLSLLIIGSAALILRIIFSFIDFDTLITIIPDDSFYYFQIASNMITGNGTSIDGINLTNGFHPLWVILISPIFALKTINPLLPIRIVLVLSGVLSLGVASVIYLITVEFTNKKWLAVFAFTIYLFTGKIFLYDMSCEPSVLSNLLLAISILIVTRVYLSGKLNIKSAAIFGVISGLAILTRTDNALFIGVFFLVLLLAQIGGKRLKLLFISAGVTCVVLSPWFLWNILQFGTIAQTSATAVPFLTRYMILGEEPSLKNQIWIFFYSLDDKHTTYKMLSLFPLQYLILVIIGSLLGAFTQKNDNVRRFSVVVLSATAAAFTLYCLHVGIGFYLREWHVASFAVVSVLIIICALYLYIDKPRYLKLTLGLLSIFYLFTFLYSARLTFREPAYPWQTEMYRAAYYIKEHPNEKFAVYDGGIIGYFSDGAALPIDGNVNPGAFYAVKEKRLYDYMKESGVDFLIGYGEANDMIYKPFWPYPFDDIFEEVPSGLDDPDVTLVGTYSIYKLKK